MTPERYLAVGLLCLALSACGSNGKPGNGDLSQSDTGSEIDTTPQPDTMQDTATTSGTLTGLVATGKAGAGVVVEFQTLNGVISKATTNAEGKYEVQIPGLPRNWSRPGSKM